MQWLESKTPEEAEQWIQNDINRIKVKQQVFLASAKQVTETNLDKITEAALVSMQDLEKFVEKGKVSVKLKKELNNYKDKYGKICSELEGILVKTDKLITEYEELQPEIINLANESAVNQVNRYSLFRAENNERFAKINQELEEAEQNSANISSQPNNMPSTNDSPLNGELDVNSNNKKENKPSENSNMPDTPSNTLNNTQSRRKL